MSVSINFNLSNWWLVGLTAIFIVVGSVVGTIVNLGTSLQKDAKNIDIWKYAKNIGIWKIFCIIRREIFCLVSINSFLAIILYLIIWLIFKGFSQIQELLWVKLVIGFSVAWILASRLTPDLKVDCLDNLIGGFDLNAFPPLKRVFKEIISFLALFYPTRADIWSKIAGYKDKEVRQILEAIKHNWRGRNVEIIVGIIIENLKRRLHYYPDDMREIYCQDIEITNNLRESSEKKLEYLLEILLKIFTRSEIDQIKSGDLSILRAVDP